MDDAHELKRILIFDDDADLRKLLLAYLDKLLPDVELEEYDPLADGAPGEDFDWSRYDVLILDYFLCIHGVTGLDILHANRKNPAFPATIMLTGAGNEEVAVRALKAGVYDYLRKQSLDKQELKESILRAYSKHGEQNKRKQDATHQGKAFNKSLFYQQLEFHKDLPGYRDRVLLLIELDRDDEIAAKAGVILRDNIVRHIAKLSFEIFNQGEFNPSITRLAEATIALLIDMPDSLSTLEYNIKGLLKHFEKQPYRFDKKKLMFSVSIGALELPGDGQPRDVILNTARDACKLAAQEAGNTYYIHGSNTTASHEANKSSEQSPVTPPTPESEPETPGQEPQEQPPETKLDNKVQAESAPATTHDTSAATPPESQAIDAAKHDRSSSKESLPVTPTARPVARQTPAAGNRPKKSLDELKAELERARHGGTDSEADKPEPAPAPGKDKPSVQPADGVMEIELDDSSLGSDGIALKKAFEEKRVIQAFQPVISLLNEEMDSDDEMHCVSLQQIAEDGSIQQEEEIRSHLTTPEFQKYVDRWLLREIIGMLTSRDRITESFIMKISDASLADAGFFNWLRNLLTGLDSKNPGRFMILEIDCKHLATLEKQASALISFLRKSHDFKFVLGGIGNVGDIARYCDNIRFDMLRCKHELIKELQSVDVEKDDGAATDADAKEQPHTLLQKLKAMNTRMIADDIADATTLTEAISYGAEYAMGDFIGEPVTQLEDETNIESFEIV